MRTAATTAAVGGSCNPADGQAVRALASGSQARLTAAALDPDFEPLYLRVLARTAREEDEFSLLRKLLTDHPTKPLDAVLR